MSCRRVWGILTGSGTGGVGILTGKDGSGTGRLGGWTGSVGMNTGSAPAMPEGMGRAGAGGAAANFADSTAEACAAAAWALAKSSGLTWELLSATRSDAAPALPA